MGLSSYTQGVQGVGAAMKVFLIINEHYCLVSIAQAGGEDFWRL